MADIFQDQRKFMQACGQTTDCHNVNQYSLYLKLIQEETQELVDAVNSENSVEQLDALIDILVVTTGALHSLGVDPEGAWKEVMRSNFAKVDTRTGQVTRREDGKILKPQGWEPPRLESFVRRS